MFDVSVKSTEFAAQWDSASAALKGRLLSVVEALETALVALARSKADGDAVKVKSGLYLASIQGKVSASGNRIVAAVWSDTAYSGTIDYGATTGAHEILPDVAMALRFGGGVGDVYASVVHDPGAHIAAHPVIHAALDEMRAQIIAELTSAAEGFSA